MRLVFSRSHSIGSLAIRGVSWGPWSHCGAWTPEGTVLEATWPHGVQEVSLITFAKRASEWAFVDIQVPDEAAGLAWARSQMGKPYDIWGALGLGLHREWQSDDSWWCSEYVEMAVAKAGRARYRTHLQRVTPTHSWMAA